MRQTDVTISDPRTHAVKARVHVRVAKTEAERAAGYKTAMSVPWDNGMLFVFPHSSTWSFWMKDTFVPLDLVFVDEKHHVSEIRRLAPLDETSVKPRLPAWAALEVPAGYVAAHGVQVGDQVDMVSDTT